ncbi:hypothetical protein M405DRAFT_834216, partial [Rhizopogon salebrosus TDB-379]
MWGTLPCYAGIPQFSKNYTTSSCTHPIRSCIPRHFLCDPDTHISSGHCRIVTHSPHAHQDLIGPSRTTRTGPRARSPSHVLLFQVYWCVFSSIWHTTNTI